MVCYLADYFDEKRVFKAFKGANGKFNNAFLLQSFPIKIGTRIPSVIEVVK